MREELVESYGYLFEEALIQEIVDVGHEVKIKSGEVLIDYGQNVKHMPLLIKGAIKVLRQDDDGDELLLYFLENGDTCTMTMTCCMGESQSEVKAIAEKDSTLFLLPVEKMAEWTRTYKGWMAFVFESYNNRFNEMLEAIDSLAFSNMHDRLYKYLKNKVMVNKLTVLEATHQEIAYDLHTSRVVISRLLKSLENEKKVKLFRNKLEVIDF
ncbi:MAG: Crp/Fnr family transcriptional regulator [Crocinitomicaceae bacterium]|nr:Crp/Fnr family transcriptional regulator [Crocinitomicaceae bacterium]MDG1776279.1 Crp/Fnr family transcriptional regulator [Crocinitomicaceae bacterium]